MGNTPINRTMPSDGTIESGMDFVEYLKWFPKVFKRWMKGRVKI
jgi:hypothetical protein